MKIIYVILCAVIFFSCKKDPMIVSQSPNMSTASVDTMLPLAVGNYWIYQKSQDDSMDNFVMLNEFDSVYVVKDSMILGERYFMLMHANNQFVKYFNFEYGTDTMHVWIKDSLGSLINYPRKTLLDPYHLRDTIYRDYTNTQPNCYAAIVPDTFLNRNFAIGTHSGIWMKNYYITTAPYNLWGGMNMFDSFVKNIGVIKSRYAYSACPKYCRYSQHLIRYHLN